MTNDLTHYTYNRDLNWYFNAVNLPNQKLAFATKEFIEQYCANEVKAEQFLNLLFRQKDAIAEYIDKPFDYLQHLQGIPLTDTLRHTLYGMLIYWHGGNPEMMLTEDANSQNYQTILKLVNEEFWKQFPEEETPEKSFCSNEPAQRQLKEAVTTLRAEMKAEGSNADVSIGTEGQANRRQDFPGSHYINSVSIDFEGLPHYVILKGIIHKWEEGSFRKDSDYQEWAAGLQNFLNTVPDQYRVLALRKGIEYGQKCYDYHLAHDCNNPTKCQHNESWERRITIGNAAIEKAEQAMLEQSFPEKLPLEPESRNPDFTTARQVLALHYILEQLQVRGTETDKAAKERFTHFLTGKSQQNIHAAFTDPHTHPKTKNFRFDDLQFIRKYFEDLGLSEIVKAINNQLSKPR